MVGTGAQAESEVRIIKDPAPFCAGSFGFPVFDVVSRPVGIPAVYLRDLVIDVFINIHPVLYILIIGCQGQIPVDIAHK